MADAPVDQPSSEFPWVVCEDGCLRLDDSVVSLTFHRQLNVILLVTNDSRVKVLDVCAGMLLQSSTVCAASKDPVQCMYIAGSEKLLITDGRSVGLRGDHHGVLLLDTILQTTVNSGNDVVKLELLLSEGLQLLQCLQETDVLSSDQTEEVRRELEIKICKCQAQFKGNPKVTKWSTICLELPHVVMKSVFAALVAELKRLNRSVPSLSIASAVSERLNYLLPPPPSPDCGASLAVERSLMFSEAARRETFGKWPHMNYKWALPDQMSQAGFYHQSNSTGDDRAMCFTCSICLMCWEPTDEPWSEHERHSPSCPFVKGEYTQNVPLSVTYASSPAVLHSDRLEEFSCISPTSYPDLVATASESGNVVVWNVSKTLKKEFRFSINPKEPLIKLATSQRQRRHRSDRDLNASAEEGAASSSSGVFVEDAILSALETNEVELMSPRFKDDLTIHAVALVGTTELRLCGDTSAMPAALPKRMKLGFPVDTTPKSGCWVGPRPSLVAGVALPDPLRHSSGHAGLESLSTTAEQIQLVRVMNDVNQTGGGGGSGTATSALDIMKMELEDDEEVEEEAEDNSETDSEATSSTTDSSAAAASVSLDSAGTRSSVGLYLVQYALGWQPPSATGDAGATAAPSTKMSTSTGSQRDNGTLYKSSAHKNLLSYDQLMAPYGLNPFAAPSSLVQVNLDFSLEQTIEEAMMSVGFHSGGSDDGLPEPKYNLQGHLHQQQQHQHHNQLNQHNQNQMSAQHRSDNSSSANESGGPGRGTRDAILAAGRRCRAVKCVEIPGGFGGDTHRISHVIPTPDKWHLLVVVSPLDGASSSCSSGAGCPNERGTACAGALLIYRLVWSGSDLLLSDAPVLQRALRERDEVVTSVSMLPGEVGEDMDLPPWNDIHRDCVPLGHAAMVVASGCVVVVDMNTLECVAEAKPPAYSTFVAATYCTSVERLCAVTSDGHLLLLQLIARDKCTSAFLNSLSRTAINCPGDPKEELPGTDSGDDLLINRPLTLDVLSTLLDLTQFANLTPRFAATVPACWTEIKQEQKQRRHPQHLQQQGESNHHTRSWRLQADSATWDEHLFEITLPRTVCVGHIDLKFNLQPVFTTPPNIQVTLLKQNTNGMGKKDVRFPDVSSDTSANSNAGATAAAAPTPTASTSTTPTTEEYHENPVFHRSFLVENNAEILCGPLPLSASIDLSGHSGVVTLTSPELVRTTARTFLIHLKTLSREDTSADVTANGAARESMRASGAVPQRPPLRWQTLMKMQDKHGPAVPSLQSLLELYVPPSSAVELLAAGAANRKADTLRGCDLFHEISITVRSCKPSKSVNRERMQRLAMLESDAFQERLLDAVCSREVVNKDMTDEHQTNVALDILNWITAIQSNSVGRDVSRTVFDVVQDNLLALIKCCFLDAGRTIAHKCAKLIVQCLEFSKTSRGTPSDMDACLLQALLYWLPHVAECRSAGAMRWFFLLLNRAKCVEAGAVSRECLALLVSTVRELDSRADPLHALLRSRFGLHRTPFELELFDVEAPLPPKPTSTPVTYAAVVGGAGGGAANSNLNNNNNNGVAAAAVAAAGMSSVSGLSAAQANASCQTSVGGGLLGSGGAASLSEDGQAGSLAALGPPTQQLRGLLEVEPLHFTCHAASDGTKLEKVDSGAGVLGSAGSLSLSPNMTVYVPSVSWTKQITTASHQCMNALKDLRKTEEDLIKALKQSQNLSNGVGPSAHSAFVPTAHSASIARGTSSASSSGSSGTVTGVPVSPWQHLFQPLTQQALVIERMHSGARRFVVLDFGRAVLLTDLMIPACPDLVSLSIDIWSKNEEIDGERLVVSTDIWYRSLVMNDLLPPPVCRFLKITAIGRYGMTTTRCRIPMGAFYGHTVVPSWLQPSADDDEGVAVDSPTLSANEPDAATVQQQLQTNLQVLSLLLEDVHCRYSLACDKLRALLGPLLAADFPNAGHAQVFMQREQQAGRAPPDDERRVFAAYRDCVQLQQQFNLVAATMERLSRSSQIPASGGGQPSAPRSGLRHVCTDKLRVLSECLLVALLGTTYRPAVGAAAGEIDRPTCELLFRYMAVGGSGRFQAMANALLVRTCGLQRWWGAFVANMLVELYHSNQTAIFPQDRVFLLMVSCHDKGLLHNTMPSILELLQKLLNPVINSVSFIQGSVDLQLVGWVLLFVSFYLDIAEGGANSDAAAAAEADAKAGVSNTREKELSPTNRWDFIQEEWAMLKNQANQLKTASRRLYRRKLQKRLMYHKQQLEDLEQVKKSYIPLKTYSALKNHFGARVAVDVDAAMQLVKKMIKHQPIKHYKESGQARRGPLGAGHGMDEPYPSAHLHHPHGQHVSSVGRLESGREALTEGREPSFLLPRTQSLQVARGLALLLLSMDYTCNVDMFLLACKVLAKIVTLARPAIGLGEIVSQSQLDQLLWRCIGHRGAVDSPSWGGPWAVHAITCFLQDILDGERLYPIIRRSGRERTPTAAAASSSSSSASDNSVLIDPVPSTSAAGASDTADLSSGLTADSDKNPMQFQNDANLVGLIKLLDVDSDDTSSDEVMMDSTPFPLPTKYAPLIMKKTVSSAGGGSASAVLTGNKYVYKPLCFTLGSQASMGGLPMLPPKESSLAASPDFATAAAAAELLPIPTVSAAVDSRMEMGVDVCAELRLKMMTFVEADVFFNAFLYPITPPADDQEGPPAGAAGGARPFSAEPVSPLQFGSVAASSSSVDMLAICFDRLFQHARMPGVDLEALLQLWISLNEATTESVGHVLPLSSASAAGIMAALAGHATLSLRSWYLAFRVLHMPLGQRSSGHDDTTGSVSSVARTLATDSNLLPVLLKFLSGSGLERGSGTKCSVGPSVSSAMCNFVMRLIHSCRAPRSNCQTGIHLKEQLLRIVFLLTANDGPVREGHGPLDAQCHLIQMLLTVRFEGVATGLQLSVVETVASLVDAHLHARRRVACRSSTESDASDASCFGGILSVLPRTDPSGVSSDGNRSTLVHALLSLCIRLVTSPVAEVRPTTTSSSFNSGSSFTSAPPSNTSVSEPLPFLPTLLTDALKMKRRSSGGATSSSSSSGVGRGRSRHAASSSGTSPFAAPPPQTDDQRQSAAGGLPSSCTHTHALSLSPKQQYIADEVLRHEPTVMYLLSSLSACSGSTVAMLLGPMGISAAASSGGDDEERFFLGEPVSVGDIVFQLLCSLNAKASSLTAILQPILAFLSSGSSEMQSVDGRNSVANSLSEPLLWFIMRILDCETSVSEFLALGGVQVICNNLVSSHLMQVNGHPSLLSVIMQKVNSLMAPTCKGQWPNLDRVDGLVNFAPLGSISLKDPTIHPADILIQPTPPHRRARTPAWSYHFYPEEAWVDLTITLPCAILLQEVHIQPHLASLATCPSAVALEISADGLCNPQPVCPPRPTGGLTFVRLQLQRPEIATVVTVRLYKPRDSANLGLSQVLLLGSSAFGEAVAKLRGTGGVPSEANVARSSVGWLRLLHHCLSQPCAGDTLRGMCAAAAAVPGVLDTCCSLLLTPTPELYATHIELVLLHLGRHDTRVSLQIINVLLQMCSSPYGQGNWCHVVNRHQSNWSTMDAVMDIVFMLCTIKDSSTMERMGALLEWLCNAARKALNQPDEPSFAGPYGIYTNVALGTEEPHGVAAQTFIHCIASILWALNDAGFNDELNEIINVDVFSLVYRWTTGPSKSNTRRAAYSVLSAICYVRPSYFVLLMEWMGLGAGRRPRDEDEDNRNLSFEPMDDDHDRYRQAPITDDSKESGSGAGRRGSRHRGRRRRRHTAEWDMREFVMLVLDVGHLSSLAAASQSPTAVRRLIDSGLPATLATAILGFCVQQGSKLGESSTSDLIHAHTMTDADKAGRSSPFQDDQRFEVNGEQVAQILNFFTEVCSEGSMRDWLGGPEGSTFWQPLLDLLCLPLSHSPLLHSRAAANGSSGAFFLSTQERAALEVATIQFLAQCCWCHPDNQQLLAQVLCEVIGKQVTLSQGGFGMLHSISGFARRLIIQLLLESEKILIFIKSHLGLWNNHQVAPGNRTQHPRFGCGHRFRLLYASTQMTCADIVKCVLGDSGAFPLGSSPDAKDGNIPDGSGVGASASAAAAGSSGGAKAGGGGGLGPIGSMEWVDYLSVAAGVLAKDKRHKDAAAASTTKIPVAPPGGGLGRDPSASTLGSLALSSLELIHDLLPNQPLPEQMTVAQLLTLLGERGHTMGCPHVVLTLQQGHRNRADTNDSNGRIQAEALLGCQSFPSALQVFASVGGLALLAQYLPVLYPDIGRATTPANGKVNGGATGGGGLGEKTMNDLGSVVDADWVKVEAPDDIFDMPFQDFPELLHPGTSTPRSTRNGQLPPSVPPHSLAAFGLFLRLPGYAETLLKERQKAQCLLRLALGVTDDGEGGDILSSPIASSLPTLPFQVIQQLFNSTPLSTDDGVLLRRMALDVGAIHLVLACLSVLSHQNAEVPVLGIHPEIILSSSQVGTPSQETQPTASATATGKSDDKSHLYWAKGTGFGTGSTTQSWDVEQAILRQRSEEEHVTCLLRVLASYIHPRGQTPRGHLYAADDDDTWAAELSEDDDDDNDDDDDDRETEVGASASSASALLLPPVLPELLAQSCVFATISSYLRNDSVLDMARHVPLYRALLKLLRAMAVSSQLVGLLLPSPDSRRGGAGSDGGSSSGLSVCCLLTKMKLCVDTYASRLRSNRSGRRGVGGLVGGSSSGGGAGGKVHQTGLKTKEEEDESEGLALLIPDIQETARVVKKATERLVVADDDEDDFDPDVGRSEGGHRGGATLGDLVMERRLLQKSTEDRYVEIMRRLQFDTFEMIVEDDDGTRFTVSHHFESNMRAAGDHGHPSRSRRLAQETVTLSTSLPLSYSSSVFVRCDQDRLDLMKVLITGPSDTPYANGCFEFDVYFPPDYPNSPMLINLETTGHHTVRFNPNLYNDGKVCLSILNTWHGRPEEKWNPQTSSFLQVLVSIQSLILVGEPYFNEPGYERSRGTPSGQQSSREYDSNIQQATVKWAMLEQLRSSCSCFKEVIHRHFWMKRSEIVKQCQGWISDMEVQGSDRRTGRAVALNCQALKRHFTQLNEELARLKPPPGLEDLAESMDWASLVPGAGVAPTCNGEAGDDDEPLCPTKEEEELAEELLRLTTDDEEAVPPTPPPPPPTTAAAGEGASAEASLTQAALLFCGPV